MRAGRGAGALRHRRAEARGRAPDPAAGRRGAGRRYRQPRPAAGAGRCPIPSQFRLSARDGRGDLQIADGRADPARRPGASACWWCRTARRATTPRRRSRRWRPSPWCWPSWWPAAIWCRATRRGRRKASACCRCGWKGWSSAPGLAIGRAVLHKPRPTLAEIVAENPASERERLHSALSGLQPRPRRSAAARRSRRRRRACATSWKPIACSPRIAAGASG